MNIEQKIEFRKKVEELLKSVPEGKRVTLKPYILEELLFDEFVLIPEDKEKVKLPTWSGDFLSKIDLSEVSFENVSWSSLMKAPYVYRKGFIIENCSDDYIESLYLRFRKNFVHVLSDEYSARDLWGIADEWEYKTYDALVNYSNTNAKIDFLKSWEAKKTGKIIVFNCNFNGTNLSNLDFNKVEKIALCNLSNTGIKIDNSTFLYLFRSQKIENIDFSNNDFSNIILSFDYIPASENTYCNMNLSNTGARIEFDYPNIVLENNYNEFDIEVDKENLLSHLKDGVWNGCYYKDILIQNSEKNAEKLMNFMLTGETKQELINDELARKQISDENIKSVIEDLKEQIKKL